MQDPERKCRAQTGPLLEIANGYNLVEGTYFNDPVNRISRYIELCGE